MLVILNLADIIKFIYFNINKGRTANKCRLDVNKSIMDEKSYQLSKVVIFEPTGGKNRLKDKSSTKAINSLIILIINHHKNCRLTFWRV